MSKLWQKPFDHSLTLLGSAAVGKSSIIGRFSKDIFFPMYTPTSGKPLIHIHHGLSWFALCMTFNRNATIKDKTNGMEHLLINYN